MLKKGLERVHVVDSQFLRAQRESGRGALGVSHLGGMPKDTAGILNSSHSGGCLSRNGREPATECDMRKGKERSES